MALYFYDITLIVVDNVVFYAIRSNTFSIYVYGKAEAEAEANSHY